MNTIICKGCGNEIDEGEALNGYCDKCVDKFVKQPDPEPRKHGFKEITGRDFRETTPSKPLIIN
jgi:predicted amidophosphoribosyltransferase